MVFRKIGLLLVVLLMTACAPAPDMTATPTASATLPPPATATAIVLPTATLTPSPEPTETPLPTQTASPTPMAQFDTFEITSIEKLQVGGVRLTLKLEGIGVPLNLSLNSRTYECKPDINTPDRLFCFGLEMPPLDQQITAILTNPSDGQEVWTDQTVARSSMIRTVVQRVYIARGECSEPGKNLGCETECRINTDGTPCVVSTCFDVCGAYFSVHTCDPNMNKPFAMCPGEVTEQMKTTFGLP